MTTKGGSKQACAVCKYQRRKCEKNCKLAKYFPADQPKTFQNVHRLYGVRSIMRILSSLQDDEKDMAMKTIIFESNMRAQDPVNGCWGHIFRLQHQLQASMEELRQVSQQLGFWKNQTQAPSPSLELGRAMNNLGIYGENNHQEANGFCVGIDGGDAKHFIKIDRNPNYYSSILNNMPLGIHIPMQLQEMESISIHDDHLMAFQTAIPDHGKGKKVSDASSSNIESKDSEISQVVRKFKPKSDASSSKMLQFDPRKMTG